MSRSYRRPDDKPGFHEPSTIPRIILSDEAEDDLGPMRHPVRDLTLGGMSSSTGRSRYGLMLSLTLLASCLVVLAFPEILLGSTDAGERTTTTTPTPTITEGSVAAGLHEGLVDALERARAASDIEIPVSSGFRTVDEQQSKLDAAIEEHGSRAEAERWVFPPERSMHTRGLAIDIGSGPAADWLKVHGAGFGICQTLSWEWWHFEWRRSWEEAGTCPAPADTPEDAPRPD